MESKERLEDIRKIFDLAITEDGWDMEGEMLYSFFFVGKDPEKLETLGDMLAEGGFDFVDIFELGDEDTEEPTGEFLLHIDQVGVYTPETLAKQVEAFEELSEKEQLGAFDGWECGYITYQEDDSEIEEGDESEEDKD
jgi:hypothetical protein